MLFSLSAKRPKAPTPASNTTSQESGVIKIKDQKALQSYLDTDQIQTVKTLVYQKIKSSVVNPKTTYTAEVREWSYRITTKNQATTTSFMVDIPEVKQSYRVEAGNSSDGYGAVYVFCPSAQQLIYPAFSCSDAEG
jgi:hypothetical protein